MKVKIHLLAALFSLGLMFQATSSNAGVASATTSAKSAENRSGLYAVASSAVAETPSVDISVSSGNNVQVVTITSTSNGTYRVVLTDSEGQILRSRNVEGEAALDFYSLPNGTYRLAILSGSGELVMHQTLLKR